MPITCVITSFNNHGTLQRALRSVLNQTLVPQEILIADDASSPEARQEVLALDGCDARVRVIARERNVGVNVNRHLAILEASQPFITTLDGDDEFTPDKIRAEWSLLSGRRDAIACSDAVLDEDGERLGRSSAGFIALNGSERLRAALGRVVRLPYNMLYSKDIYLRSGGYEAASGMYGDWSLKLRLVHQTPDWLHVPKAGTVYHRHGGGISGAPPDQHVLWKAYAIARNTDWLTQAIGVRAVLDVVLRIFRHHQDPSVRRRARDAADALATLDVDAASLRPLERLAARSLMRAQSERLARELEILLVGLEGLKHFRPTPSHCRAKMRVASRC